MGLEIAKGVMSAAWNHPYVAVATVAVVCVAAFVGTKLQTTDLGQRCKNAWDAFNGREITKISPKQVEKTRALAEITNQLASSEQQSLQAQQKINQLTDQERRQEEYRKALDEAFQSTDPSKALEDVRRRFPTLSTTTGTGTARKGGKTLLPSEVEKLQCKIKQKALDDGGMVRMEYDPQVAKNEIRAELVVKGFDKKDIESLLKKLNFDDYYSM